MKRCKHTKVSVVEVVQTTHQWVVEDGKVVDKGLGDFEPAGVWEFECLNCRRLFRATMRTNLKRVPEWVREAQEAALR